MSPQALILLPPSERKAQGGLDRAGIDAFAKLLSPARDQVRAALDRALATMTLEQLSRLLGEREELLESSLVAMGEFVAGTSVVLPAWRRYSGVVWEHLDPSTLRAPARSRILVPSGLYGINRATDDIADYRLTMHAALPGVGNLARYWMAPISDGLREHYGRRTIISLLPKEHARSVQSDVARTFLEVDFRAADGRGAAGHAAKAVKGRFARHLLDNGPDDALGFRFEGWKIRRSLRGYELLAPR